MGHGVGSEEEIACLPSPGSLTQQTTPSALWYAARELTVRSLSLSLSNNVINTQLSLASRTALGLSTQHPDPWREQ